MHLPHYQRAEGPDPCEAAQPGLIPAAGHTALAAALPTLCHGKSRQRLSRFMKQEYVSAPTCCLESTLLACPKEDAPAWKGMTSSRSYEFSRQPSAAVLPRPPLDQPASCGICVSRSSPTKGSDPCPFPNLTQHTDTGMAMGRWRSAGLCSLQRGCGQCHPVSPRGTHPALPPSAHPPTPRAPFQESKPRWIQVFHVQECN